MVSKLYLPFSNRGDNYKKNKTKSEILNRRGSKNQTIQKVYKIKF